MKLTWVIFFLLLAISKVSFAQVTEVYGVVTDAVTKEPLPSVNIRFKGLARGAATNLKGEYKITTQDKADSLSFSYLGYVTRILAVKQGDKQELNVEMGANELELLEITVKAGKRKRKREIDTAANYVFYQVLKHKEQNRNSSYLTLKYEAYEKFQISLMNPSEKFQNFSLFRPFHFAFENKDTTETGSMYIPGVIKEMVSDVYVRTHPRLQEKIFVKAEKMTGIDNPSVYNLVQFEFRQTDPYDNLYYFAKTFFSAPFAPVGIGIYNYYLTDTQKIEGRISYKLHFVGKTKEDLALKGYAWIDSATWAIRSIAFRPNEKANLNFINEYDAKIDFDFVDGQYWIKSREQMNSVGSLFKKRNKLSLLVQKTVEKKNFEINVLFPDSVTNMAEGRMLLDSARHRDKWYWDTTRFSPLTRSQQRVFEISDTIKDVPAWKTYQWLGVFFTTAFADAGPISFGKVLNYASRNSVEGWRLRFGFETNPRFRKRGTPVNNFMRTFYFTGYVAYGLQDKNLKYHALSRIALPRVNEKWQALEFMYRNDLRIPGQDEMQTLVTFDNIFTLISGRTLSKVMRVEEFGVSYEKDWLKDFSTIISFKEKTFYDVPGVSNFAQEVNNVTIPVTKFNVTEFTLDARYSYKNIYIFGNFYRYFPTTHYPVLMLRYTAGLGNIRNDYFNYHNFIFTFKHRLYSTIGYTNYSLKLGKILGRAPYTVANLTQGNIGILMDKYNYNLLREFEFVTDQYAQFWLEHHFNGFFFNKIPGFNKLRLREVVVFKSLIGSFSQRNAGVLQVPRELMAPGPVPYIELGFGIENIAYVFRVDFLWRATYRNNGGQNWGVKFIFQPGF